MGFAVGRFGVSIDGQFRTAERRGVLIPSAGVSPAYGTEKPGLEIRITGAILALIARFLSGASVRWLDSQPDTCQRVYFANHTSHLDAIVIWSALPSEIRTLTRPVAAKDYWTAGRVRHYLATRVFNALLIDRTEIKVHQSPVDVMIREIGHRYSLIVFPEGGRTTGEEIGEFKSGLYYLCKKRPDLEVGGLHDAEAEHLLEEVVDRGPRELRVRCEHARVLGAQGLAGLGGFPRQVEGGRDRARLACRGLARRAVAGGRAPEPEGAACPAETSAQRWIQ